MAILLIGSAIKLKDMSQLQSVNDIDLFVIYDNKVGFEREIKQVDNIWFDINYFDIGTIKNLIEKKVTFVLKALNKNKIIISCSEINDLIKYAKQIYIDGPDSVTDLELEYIRFNYTERLEEVRRNISNLINFNILAHVLVRDLIKDYFKLNRMWVPKDKKLLAELKEKDTKLYSLCNAFFQIEEQSIKYDYLNQIIHKILEHFGGLKYNWEKGDFPIL